MNMVLYTKTNEKLMKNVCKRLMYSSESFNLGLAFLKFPFDIWKTAV